MEDSTEELSDAEVVDSAGVLERALSLGQRVREVAMNQPEAGAWFAMWKPVVAAVVGLGKTLGKLLFNLRKIADSDDSFDPLPADLRAELIEDLRDITTDFPDISDVLFGFGNLDTALDALREDDDTRTLASSLYESSIALLDRFLDALVDIVLGERESPLKPDRIIAAVERFEHIAQRLLDRWLLQPND